MISETKTDMIVTVIAENEQILNMGQLTQGNMLLKTENEIVLMPQRLKSKRNPENPILYEGHFFTARQKRNGNIALHAVIHSKTELDEGFNTATQELMEFFTKLGALL